MPSEPPVFRRATLPKSTQSVEVPMSEDDADRFRRQAEECRQEAERAVSLLDKEAWLRVASEWIKLAQAAEERRDKR
jgi:anaerobic glycerol-3-phosphate dehydrogenase